MMPMSRLVPERLVSHALMGLRIRLWPQRGAAAKRGTIGLLARGRGRDPYAKLTSDWPACFPRARLKS